ncbi:uncharacterized protein LOC128681403 [Plodia interpunctella]|uniref:uncharacterized protein LOC128681403 n=1 Tax=Plodia interpunctella TaxID=58824 RepID=UPI002367F6B1|nr:uncharacterized protein LOC128681403 [Plodia interpunctella]
MVKRPVTMLGVLVLCPVLLAAVQTLTIDSQLGTSIEDCFERISIGEQLPSDAIYRNVSELTTRECEQICKQDKLCQTYDYGVGAKGNATCNLSNLGEKEIKDRGLLKRHPDYDVYVRRLLCEQSPPTPIQVQFDEPEDGPHHRPVFRPDDDEPKHPLSDDYISSDIRPYSSHRPPYNHIDDRPDDYTNSKPLYDRPPSYGDHRPQDIPYKPIKKPDDVLQFQEQYKPNKYENWRPDPHYPSRPEDDIPDLYGQRPRPEFVGPYRPEKPDYHYIVRPNRKPRPPEDYPIRPQVYPTRPDPYIQNDISHPSGPIGPPDIYRPSRPSYHPIRPNDHPSYSYNTQYASNYGQNHDNSIYVEINDPPRPYKPYRPLRPEYGPVHSGYGPNYGYGNQGSYYGNSHSQNSYSHSHSQSQYYGTGSITDITHYDPYRPHDPVYRPQKPVHDSPKPGYGIQRPDDEIQKPGYGSYDQGNRPNSGSQKPNDEKPSYGISQDPYGGQVSHDGQGSYGVSQASYVSSQASYGSSQSSYGSSQGSHGSSQGSYSSNQGSLSDSQNNRPYGSNQDTSPGYGSHTTQKPSGGYYKPTYNDKPSYNDKPDGSQSHLNSDYNNDDSTNGYGSYGLKPTYTKPSASYGGNRPPFGSSDGSYGYKPINDNPYGGNRPLHDGNGGYGNKPSYDVSGSYGQKPFDINNAYNKPQNDHGGYGISNSPYGSKPNYEPYGNKPYQETFSQSYGSNGQYSHGNDYSNRPDGPYYDEKPNDAPSYNNINEDTKNNRKPGVRPNETGYDRPNIKPVYEYELDKPMNVPSYIARPGGDVITSRPVIVGDYGHRGYGRPISYKACFRRVLAGRRALRSFVRKVVNCERLEDCRRECAEERRFPCESFNYRLDPTFRGKGLCELMTKPIEAFDLQRDFVDDKDYDFYEIDRNSLEPYCPESLRGPSLLHSGFLSSKPNKAWDRQDWFGSRYNEYDRFYDRRGSNRRGYENFIPYQIGTGIARSNDDQENWGKYGGYYGGYDEYYKDRNDYFKSTNYWRLPDDHHRPYGVKPLQNNNFDYNDLNKNRPWESHRYGYGSWKRGRWNSSGLNWNELDSEGYKKTQHYYEDRNEEASKDCSSRRRPGMSLGTGAIRRSLIARNVVECEAACFGEREFKCVSYSYRYSSSRGIDNCFLSERPYRGLELSADSGSDVYAMPQDHGCATISPKPWVESECFWHVRSGAAVGGPAVRAALTVAGLGACEAECIRAHGFFCRGFSFRFDSPTIGDDLENCILTSSPPTSLEVNRGLRPNAGHELYSRGNYGRGCEPALYDDAQHKETQCYLQYDNAARLKTSSVRGQALARSEEACGHACTEAPFKCLSFSYKSNAPPGTDNCLLSEIRLFDLQRGVDYEHSTDDWLFAFDLFNGECWRKIHGNSDYDHPSDELPRPLPQDRYPVTGSGSPGYLPTAGETPYVPSSGPPSGPGYKPNYPTGPEPPKQYPGPSPFKTEHSGYRPGYLDTGPGYLPEPAPKPVYRPTAPNYPETGYKPGYIPDANRPDYKPSYRPDYPSGPTGPGYKPTYFPEPPTGPDYKPIYTDSGFKPGYPPSEPPGYKPGYLPGNRPYEPKPDYGPPNQIPQKPGYPADKEEGGPITVSWRHYTVSGFPCRAGTACARNAVAGHWACEPEGGEVGSWDYCCSPTHRCGYSEGFHKPWCYVGPNEDQWRPCSDKYYPYHQHNAPHPVQAQRPKVNPPPYPDRWDRPYDTRDTRPPGPYLSENDRRYWDELYKNGPQAYYDKFGNPLPGYTRVPPAGRPGPARPPSAQWLPLNGQDFDPQVPGGLGAPRYWPVAYLHKGPPPNMTYFRYNETQSTTTERYNPRPENNQKNPPRDIPPSQPPLVIRTTEKPELKLESRSQRDERTKDFDDKPKTDIFQLNTDKVTSTTPKVEIKPVDPKPDVTEDTKTNNTVVEIVKTDTKVEKEKENIKGIDDKIDDFSAIEVLNIEDVKGDKKSDLKTLEAEERQIEAIGRLLASRRGSKLILEKRSQKDLEAKSIAVDKDTVDFNFGNKFPTTGERRGIIQKVTKDEIEREKGIDKSLEVSETTFVRPPRVLSTTENIRKAIVNGKVFYDATIREQRDIFANTTRKPKTFRHLDDIRAPSVITNSTFGKKKIIKARNVNPVRRVRRVYRKRYNPDEVRRRLLERERTKPDIETARKI